MLRLRSTFEQCIQDKCRISTDETAPKMRIKIQSIKSLMMSSDTAKFVLDVSQRN